MGVKVIKYDAVQSTENYIKEIKEILSGIESGFIMLGHKLIYASEYYQNVINKKTMLPCKNVYEFAEQEFKLKKSSVKNYISVAKKFSVDGLIMDKYKGYTYTQLSIMLTLTEYQLKLCNENMSIEEIKSLKKVKNSTGQLIGQSDNITSEIVESTKESRLLKLNNDIDRREFLENYRTWAKIGSIEIIGLNVYKAEIDNGDYMLALSAGNNVEYSLITNSDRMAGYYGSKKFNLLFSSVNQLVEYFRKYKCNPLLDV